ncbi:MAG TPA: Fe-S cluster assembly protein SufD [Acidimicrobiales bacterium]|jgi:Fe-S cluster assembly protein SufD|nr:Fe-S cluster assembly protein SufD [Acidimicrobiales bacterium]
MSARDFGPDAARALGGPRWLQARRLAAAERFASASLPSTEEEVWRYSRIADLDLDRYVPAPPSGDGVGAEVTPALLDATARAGLVIVRDGVVAHVDLDRAAADAGLYVGRLVDHPEAASLLGCVLTDSGDVFAGMNDAFAADPVAVVVPRGVRIDKPVVVVQHVSGSGIAVFPRLVVRAGEDGGISVLEHQQSGDGDVFIAPVVELHAHPAARLAYANVQQLGRQSWQVASHLASGASASEVVMSAAGLGGEYARVRTDCRLDGRGATGSLASLYFGDEDQTLDFRTFQDHAAPDTTSNLLFKGVVADRSKSVYTGLIRVRKEARGTNAFQTNRNIKLSDDAWAESVPNLEIENNEVRCSHASAVGPIDEDQRFYLESRGVPPHVAERLIVAGFFADVLGQFAVPAAAAALRASIAEKLDRRGV